MVQEAMEQQPLIDIFDLFILVNFFLNLHQKFNIFVALCCSRQLSLAGKMKTMVLRRAGSWGGAKL